MEVKREERVGEEGQKGGRAEEEEGKRGSD